MATVKLEEKTRDEKEKETFYQYVIMNPKRPYWRFSFTQNDKGQIFGFTVICEISENPCRLCAHTTKDLRFNYIEVSFPDQHFRFNSIESYAFHSYLNDALLVAEQITNFMKRSKHSRVLEEGLQNE